MVARGDYRSQPVTTSQDQPSRERRDMTAALLQALAYQPRLEIVLALRRQESTPTALGGTPVTIHLTVTDVDAKFQKAIDAGATVVAPLEDQFWGDRYGLLRDPFGHQWSLGQPVREVSMEELAEAMKQQQ